MPFLGQSNLKTGKKKKKKLQDSVRSQNSNKS